MLFHSKILGLLLASVAIGASAPSAQAQSPRLQAGVSLGPGSLSLEWGGSSPARARLASSAARRRLGARRTYAPRGTWVGGHYESVARQVWVPGEVRREWVPPVYETRCGYDGRIRQVLVRQGYWTEVCEPGRYVTRYVKVWVPGHWTR